MKPITPQELRIGLYFYKDEYEKRNGIFTKITLKDLRYLLKKIDEEREYYLQPVELTEEILLRLGFIKIPHLVFSSLYEFEVRKGYKIIVSELGTPNEMIGLRQGNDYVVVWNYDYDRKCMLHNLQNITSILCKELELKPKQ